MSTSFSSHLISGQNDGMGKESRSPWEIRIFYLSAYTNWVRNDTMARLPSPSGEPGPDTPRMSPFFSLWTFLPGHPYLFAKFSVWKRGRALTIPPPCHERYSMNVEGRWTHGFLFHGSDFFFSRGPSATRRRSNKGRSQIFFEGTRKKIHRKTGGKRRERVW